MHPITKQILTAAGISIGVFVVVCLYTVVRHQVFNLYILNKVVAGVSGVLLGIVVVTGTFGRIYDFFDKMLAYRKWLGIAAFLFAYLHGMITLFFLPDRFPASRFHFGNVAFVFGLLSLFVLTILFVYSFQVIIDTINRHQWWKLQNWGVRIAFVAGVAHAVLVKLPYWQRWINGEETGIGRFIPPAGLLITIGLLYVLSVRLSEFTPAKKIMVTVVTVLTIGVMITLNLIGFLRL